MRYVLIHIVSLGSHSEGILFPPPDRGQPTEPYQYQTRDRFSTVLVHQRRAYNINACRTGEDSSMHRQDYGQDDSTR